MSFKTRHTTIVLSIIILTLIIIDTFVVIKFFTYDKFNEVTISQASLNNSEKIISNQIEKLEESEKSEKLLITDSNINKDENKNTNETNKIQTNINNTENKQTINTKNTEVAKAQPVLSSRYSNERKTIENPENNKKEETTQNEKPITSNSNTQNLNNQNHVGTIEIPKTNVNLSILKNLSESGMEVATCIMYSTGSINKKGRTAIIGHNYQNGKLFSNNSKLQIGDTITITTNDGIKKTYTIYEKFITTPDDTDYLIKNVTNEPEIALSTCTNDEQNRLIILAK